MKIVSSEIAEPDAKSTMAYAFIVKAIVTIDGVETSDDDSIKETLLALNVGDFSINRYNILFLNNTWCCSIKIEFGSVDDACAFTLAMS